VKSKKTTKKKSAVSSSQKKKKNTTVSKTVGIPSAERHGYTIIAKPSKPSFSKATIEKMMAMSKEI
jgi:hypothetical protein